MNGYITCDVDNIDLSHGDKFIITANKRTNKLSGGLVNMPFLNVLILVGIDLHNEYLPMTHILVLINCQRAKLTSGVHIDHSYAPTKELVVIDGSFGQQKINPDLRLYLNIGDFNTRDFYGDHKKYIELDECTERETIALLVSKM